MTKTKRSLTQIALASLLILVIFGMTLPWQSTSAQDPTATPVVGTRVPPTLVPVPPATPTPPAVDESGIAHIQESKVLKVGTLYNAPPFSWLDENGDIVGYEPEVLRAVAVDLQIDIEFVQVTSETAEQMLLTGEIDVLVGQRIHTRPDEEFMLFSHPYFTNIQKLVVRQESGIATMDQLANRPVSVVVGSAAESALNLWIAENSIAFDVRRYLTQNEALDALASGEVDAMAGEMVDLRRAGRQGMSFVEGSLGIDPYSIAFRHHDVYLRNAVNRALQRLLASGRMDQIADNWFDPEEQSAGTFFNALIPVYANFAEDTRGIDDFPTDSPISETSVVDKIVAGQQITVAGLSLNDSAPAYQRFLDPLNREIMFEMGRRWGVNIVFMPDTYQQGKTMLTQGQADVAIGVFPVWEVTDRVEYSVPYHYHSNKIITLEGSRFGYFTDFRGGQWIGYYQDDPDDEARLNFLTETFNTSPAIWPFVSDSQVYDKMLARDIDGLYGDSLRLQAFMQDYNPDLWRFISSSDGSDFSDGFRPIVLAAPQGDIDFIALINWTLADMYADGTLQRIWNDYYTGSEPTPYIPDFTGNGDYLMNRGQ